MGLTKRYLEEVEARGWSDVDSTICSRCVVDSALIAAIRQHAGTEACDYCEKSPIGIDASAPFQVVLELVVDGIKLEYEDPAEQMAWDGGYVGTVLDTWDLLWDLDITERDDVHAVLHKAIQGALWCQRDPYAATPTQALTWGWTAFRNYVKHLRRFTFLTADQSTADGAGSIPMHAIPAAIARAVTEADLVKVCAAGDEWWRMRPHPANESYSSAGALGTPPDSVARDNRMSPKGIGAFYGASTAAGARAEVGGYANAEYVGTIGKFITAKPLAVVDLRDVPSVPSLFDPDRRHHRAVIMFLQGFVEDATEVADPSDKQNLDYVPTQVISETFRYELQVDGILWRSSKDDAVTSCVLFIPSTGVAELGWEGDDAQLFLDTSTIQQLDGPL